MHHAGRSARPERSKEGGASHPIMEREPVCDRVVLRAVRPGAEGAPLRRVAGEAVEVEAEVFAYGDEVLGCSLRVQPPGEEWLELPMTASGPGGVWQGRFEVPAAGLWRYDVAAWVDDFGSWQRRVEREGEAAPFAAGAGLLERAASGAAAAGRGGYAKVLNGLARSLREEGGGDRLRLALDPELAPLVEQFLKPGTPSRLPEPLAVRVEPAEGASLSWCALASPDAGDPLPLDRLPLVSSLGFDAVVLPLGGLLASPGIDPEGLTALRQALAAARGQGLRVALEIPARLPAGRDWAGDGWRDLWLDVARAVAAGAEEGVEAFYCAEPAAIPPGFWEWLPQAARARHPGLAFWAPAPERPEVARHLRRQGILLYERPQPSWTTADLRRAWDGDEGGRGGRAAAARELAVSLEAVALAADEGGPEQAARAALASLVLAATGSASYGLLENGLPLDALGPRWTRLLTRLNQLRRERQVFGPRAALRILPAGEPELLCYGALRGKDFYVVVLCLDGARPRAAWIELPLADLGLKEEAVFHVEDLLSGVRFLWQGRRNSVRIEPTEAPARVLRLVR